MIFFCLFLYMFLWCWWRHLWGQLCIKRCKHQKTASTSTRTRDVLPDRPCHNKDEPPVNARNKHADLRAPLYRTPSTLCIIQYPLCLSAYPPLICHFIAPAHLNFFLIVWFGVAHKYVIILLRNMWDHGTPSRSYCLAVVSLWKSAAKARTADGRERGFWTNWAFPFCMHCTHTMLYRLCTLSLCTHTRQFAHRTLCTVYNIAYSAHNCFSHKKNQADKFSICTQHQCTVHITSFLFAWSPSAERDAQLWQKLAPWTLIIGS